MNQIQKSLLRSVVFLVAAGAVGGVVFWDRQKKKSAEEQKEKDKKAFDLKAEDVMHVELSFEGQTVVADKEGTDWRIKQPVQTLGDDAAFSGVVSTVTGLTLKSRLQGEKMDPAVAGLRSPTSAVTLRTKEGKTAQVWVGKKNTFDDSYYVQAGEDASKAPVSMVAGYAVSGLEKKLFDLREKRLVSTLASDTDRFEVTVADPGPTAVSFKAVRVSKDGKPMWDDPWDLQEPIKGPADRDEINKALSSVTGTRALSFPDSGHPLSEYGLDKPAISVVIAAKGKETRFEIGSVKNGTATRYYGRRTDAPDVMELSDTVVTAIQKDIFTWRNKAVLTVDRDKVAGIHMVLPDGKDIVLERVLGDAASDTWRMLKPRPAKATSWKVSSLLYTLGDFKVTSYAREDLPNPTPEDVRKRYGFAPPSRMLELKDSTGKVMAALWVGKQEKDDVYVMAQNGPSVGLVAPAKLQLFPAGPEEFVDKESQKGVDASMADE